MEREIIYYNSDKAAQPAKLILADGTEKPLWIASDGRGFKEEHLARYAGCTHNQCKCGAWKSKGYIECDKCIEITRKARYESRTAFPYKGEPVVIYRDDTYFWSLEDIEEYCYEHEVKMEDLQLMHCEPITIPEVDWDYFNDCIPDDSDGDVFSKEMTDAVENLNRIIRSHKPVSWTEGKFRVVFGKEKSNV